MSFTAQMAAKLGLDEKYVIPYGYDKAKVSLEVLKQDRNAPIPVEKQVCIIYAVTNGYLNTIPVEKIPEFEKQLEEHMDNNHPQVLEAIRTTGKLETETENQLKAALNELVAQFA